MLDVIGQAWIFIKLILNIQMDSDCMLYAMYAESFLVNGCVKCVKVLFGLVLFMYLIEDDRKL